MKRIFLMSLLSLSLLTASHSTYDDHHILMIGNEYLGDGNYGLFLDKTTYCYFVFPIDETSNPYELIQKQEILDFEDAVDIFPNLEGLEYCYGLDC